MMHHPNMHHQQMSGHAPQHLGGHQGMPAHHQMPPHQMHRENRHVAMPRMAMGPSQPSGALGGMPGMSVPHHGPAQRQPHPIRAMHHPPGPHHGPPPPLYTNQGGMKTMRRAFVSNNSYGGGASVVSYPQPTRVHAPPTVPITGLCRPSTPPMITPTSTSARNFAQLPSRLSPSVIATSTTREYGVSAQPAAPPPSPPSASPEDEDGTQLEGDAQGPANSKEKTPMCLVNELARYNKIKHQYRLTSETGPAHKKVFTVTLRLGDTEEYTAEGSSIKRAQHAAAGAALTKTAFPAPPPRHPPMHDTSHHRHAGAVMPTVELNALAMKLCLPVEYSALPPAPRVRPPAHYRMPYNLQPFNQRMMSPSVIYRVRVTVGGQVWHGEGGTPQAARHDAAARALHELRPAAPAATNDINPGSTPNPADTSAEGPDFITSEVKSPVSMVHELALKRNLGVLFSVKSERGPPHMRVFVTACTVGDLETEGEGNGKKVSKRRSAQLMLDEMRRRWAPSLLRARPPPAAKRKSAPGKRKSRNLIKQTSQEDSGGGVSTADNPISRLAQARHSARATSPCYRVLEERGLARRREFVVLCEAPPHTATGLGPNKKTAKRRAAHNVLIAMDLVPGELSHNGELGDSRTAATTNELPGDENRQPLPGVLLMDNNYHHHQVNNKHNVPPSSSSPASSTGGTGSKEQLMYLAQLMGFTVQFSDFPKRNRGSYLSLVSLSTSPPVMCHGGGTSTASSHEHCARNALIALAKMGLDAPDRVQNPGANPTTVMTNGVPE